MEFKQLEAYVKVYELRSFSRAAEELYVSQPSVSAYLTSLERELQTQLIFRSTKEFVPTKSGKLFYEYAKDMLSLRDKAMTQVMAASDGASGSIDILASSVPAQYLLPEVLGAFHKSYPNIVFSIEQTDSSEVVKGIAAHEGEIGFVGAKIDNSKCAFEDFMSEKLVLIAPPEKRFEKLGASDVINLLRSEHFVARERGSGTRLEYEEYLKSLGIDVDKLKMSASFNNTQSIIRAVANGLGLSLVSSLAAKHYLQEGAVVPVPLDALLPLAQRHFYIVLRKDSVRSAALDTFLAFLRSY